MSRVEAKLGFDIVRTMVGELCSTEGARIMAQEAPFLTSLPQIERELSLMDEMRVITLFGNNFPESGYIDVTGPLKRLEDENYFLDKSEVAKLRNALNTLRGIVAFFRNCKEDEYPYMRELIKTIMLFPEVARRIDSIMDRFGEIKDSASEELATIRRGIKECDSTISKRIKSLFKRGQAEGIIEPDATITVREGKMLLPISSANKRKIAGVVVDESVTGRTIYLEPMEIVELNNQVRELYFAEQREVVRILVELSDFLRPYREELLTSAEVLITIDFIWAKARFALAIGGGKPIVKEERELMIKDGRHPLLERALKREGREIVPLNLTLTNDRHILLISGPNAGGKSVCLKSVGLFQYMVQCGFPVSASESSEFTIFDQIFVDIGDEQSLENDLSTYSSHLKNMRVMLESATANSLILIDEFGSGTEPTVGGAIAESILEEIEARGSFGVITTHYTNLKYYASNSRGVINGGMQFDIEKILPLFKLEIGTPGSSFAFELAKKMGLPNHIVESAEEKSGEEFVDMERHLKKIARNRRASDARLARIKNADRTLENITDRYQRELSEIDSLRREIIGNAKREAATLLSDANRKIEATIKEIREAQAERETTKLVRAELTAFEEEALKEKSEEEAKIARKMEQIIRRKERQEQRRREAAKRRGEEVKKRAEEPQKGAAPIVVGDKVQVKGSALKGEVLEIERGDAIIAVGMGSSRVSLSKLEKLSSREFNRGGQTIVKKRFSVVESDAISERRLNFKPTLDLRGERVEGALNLLTNFIDDAMMVGVGEVKILHGKGDGVLREEVRKYLRSMWGITNYRDEVLQQGGSGITVVNLD